MSNFITEAFVKQFSSNVFHLSQQKGSRLRGSVRTETQVGKSAFYDIIGTVAAQIRTTRHGDTPQLDTPHSRRRVDMFDYEWGDLVDDQDKIRMLMDPTSQYAQAAAWALGRSMDKRIILALGGSVITGEEGLNPPLALTTDRKLVSALTAEVAGPDNGDQLNVATLRRIKKKFDKEDVDESIPRYIAVNAAMLESLLADPQITSSDYNVVKALVQGEINTFLGLNFIRTELLPKGDDASLGFGASFTYGIDGELSGATHTIVTAKARVGYAWCQDGLLLATGQDIMGEIARRPDKSFSTQVYAKMSIGAVRMEEAKVVQFFVKEDV